MGAQTKRLGSGLGFGLHGGCNEGVVGLCLLAQSHTEGQGSRVRVKLRRRVKLKKLELNHKVRARVRASVRVRHLVTAPLKAVVFESQATQRRTARGTLSDAVSSKAATLG